MALIIVLGSLVMICAIVLAFLGSVRTELRSSKFYADGSSVRMLADSSVNLVIGQIKEATQGRSSTGKALAWASQPGMIRLYDTSGNAAGYYKLYSSAVMTGSSAFTPADDAVPITWASNPGLYTDLNQPILNIGSGSLQYPIVHPGAQSAGVEGFSIQEAPGATLIQPAPMPVRWLYVLQDGQIVAPTSGAGEQVALASSEANPAVARIAFWTDDETCKVNINTASEGSFWDSPRANSANEVALALSPPTQQEFQRYPGHPATTSLSPVLGWKLPVLANTDPATYYTLTPRVNDGGSKAGTIDMKTAVKITPDKDRLYATVDEFEFRPDRKKLTNSSINLSSDDLEKVRFFLTANSRAPDVNLFNRPRVGIWPVHATDDTNHRTIYDRLIAFCGTIGSKGYYFQRRDPDSPTTDLTLGRNQILKTYLKSLTSEEIPGFGGKFSTKYGSDNDQILTEIFDYIRCVNLCDSNGNQADFASYTPRVAVNGNGKAQVVPIHDASDDTRGFGRFPTLSEAAIVFVGVANHTLPIVDPAIPAGQMTMQAALLPELFDPSMGFPTSVGKFMIKVSGLKTFKWPGGTDMFANDTALLDYKRQLGNLNLTRNWGGPLGFRQALTTQNNGGTNTGFVSTVSPLVTDPLVTLGSTFAFSGGQVTIEFQTSSGTTVQTIQIPFPSTTLPIPSVISASYTPTGHVNVRSMLSRFAGTTAGTDCTWVTNFDTARGIPARDGDYRLIAGRFNIQDTGAATDLFAPLSTYLGGGQMSHALIESCGQPFYGSQRGWLVLNAPYFRSFIYPNPTDRNTLLTLAAGGDGAGGLSTQFMNQDVVYNGVALGKHAAFAAGDIPGDWDNGFGDVMDGPYINKPDEGAIDTSVVGATNGTQLGTYYHPNNLDPSIDVGGTFFSPNRQMPSAVMFGSLSTGVKSNRPWQTLLFRPDPTGRHPGGKNRKGDGTASAGAPPDHLLLDLFHMPVVEPYPISEPLSTAGRINMNYQIVPFTYINRDTGVRAVLKKEQLLAFPNNGTVSNTNQGTTAVDYKRTNLTKAVTTNWRKELDITETLKGFANRFDTGEIFKSASEICEIPLVPTGATYNNVSSTTADFWSTTYPLSGDNTREKPYANIYPRLTTKSNTYTVHFRVQTLQKSRQRIKSAPGEFNTANGDIVTGEFRGSTLIERYVDPNDPALPDFAQASLSSTEGDLNPYYRFRILGFKKFAP